MGASYQQRGSVAVITLDNPPVNGLGYDTRREFAAGVERAAADAAVVAIVITGGGRPFRAAPTSRSSAAPRRLPSPTCCR
jgi:3-hydroxyacyl-CoA dehydrogenase